MLLIIMRYKFAPQLEEYLWYENPLPFNQSAMYGCFMPFCARVQPD
jgi:hypothetical protein